MDTSVVQSDGERVGGAFDGEIDDAGGGGLEEVAVAGDVAGFEGVEAGVGRDCAF